MIEEEVIEESSGTLEGDPIQEKPVLSKEHSKKLEGIIQQMIDDDQDDDSINELVGMYQKKYGTVTPKAKTTPTTPVDPKASKAFDNRAQPWEQPKSTAPAQEKKPATPSRSIPLIPFNKRGATDSRSPALVIQEGVSEAERVKAKEEQDRLVIQQKSVEATKRVGNALVGMDGVKAGMELAKDDRGRLVMKGADQAMSTGMKGMDNFQGSKPYNQQRIGILKTFDDFLPKITEKEGAAYVEALSQTPEGQDKLLGIVIKQNPDKAPQLMHDAYINAASQDPNRNATKVAANAAQIESGELKYDPVAKKVVREAGIIEAAGDAIGKRNTSIGNYNKIIEMSDAKSVEFLNKQIQNKYDPDNIEIVPAGIMATVGSAIAGEGIEELKIAGGVALSPLTGGGSLAIAGGSVAKDYYERAWYDTLESTYAELRQRGVPEIEAYKEARDIANTSGIVDAIVNTGASLVGGNLIKGAGKGFMGAMKKALPEAALVGVGAGAGQVVKNIERKQAGLNQGDLTEGVGDAIAGSAGFMLAFGAGAKIVSGALNLGKKGTKAFFNHLAKQDPDVLTTEMANAIDAGYITPEQAQVVKQNIEAEILLDQEVPSTIKDPDARILAQDAIQKIKQLEAEKERLPKAAQASIQKRIDEQVLRLDELENYKPPKEEVSEVKPETKIEVKEYTKHEEVDLAIDEFFAMEDANLSKVNNEKFANKELKVGDEKLKVDDYVRKATVVSKALYPEMDVVAHGSDADFRKASEIDDPAYGVHSEKGNIIHLNLERMANDGKGNTAFHEAVHPILNEIASKYKGMITGMSEMIKQNADKQGVSDAIAHSNLYGTKAKQELELVTEYISLVADGKIDASTVPKELMAQVIDFVNKGLEKLGIDYRISNANDLRSLSEAIKKSFDTEDASHIEKLLGKRNKEGVTRSAEANLSLKGDSPKKYEKLKEIVSKSKNSTDDELVASLKKHIPEAEARAIVNEVRGVAEPVKKTTSVIMPEERSSVEATTIAPKSVEAKVAPKQPRPKTSALKLIPNDSPILDQLTGADRVVKNSKGKKATQKETFRHKQLEFVKREKILNSVIDCLWG